MLCAAAIAVSLLVILSQERFRHAYSTYRKLATGDSTAGTCLAQLHMWDVRARGGARGSCI